MLGAILCVLVSVGAMAEGTRQIMPTEYSHGRLEIYPYFSDFAMYGCAEEYRLNVTICSSGEKVYFGFGNRLDAFQVVSNDVSFRIKNSSGNVVFGPIIVPASGNGFISTYQQAIAGPNTFHPAGYPPLVFTPDSPGDYYFEFDFPGVLDQRREFKYFDITVADEFNSVQDGRIWSKAWQLTTSQSMPPNYFDNAFEGKMYVYSDDGIVTSIDFNGVRPLVFTVTSNSSGCYNTGNQYLDRKSVVGYHNYPEYKIFLNDPDESCYPTGELGDIIAPSTFTGCNADDFCINITVNQPGTAEIVINLNGQPGFQGGSIDRMIVTELEAGLNCVPFDGLDGIGNPIVDGTNVEFEIEYYNGVTHLPLTDVEYNENGYIVELVRPVVPGVTLPLFWDDTNIAGGTISPDDGCISSTGCHAFFDMFGDSCTINTWWYASNNAVDYIDIIFHTLEVDANENTPGSDNDTAICITGNSIQLNGRVYNAQSFQWYGGGSFIPNDQTIDPVYVFSQNELNDGVAFLTLRGIGQGSCVSLDDDMKIIVENPAVVDAGPDMLICLNNGPVPLDGYVAGATGGIWVGEGEFSPNAFNLDAFYHPSADEVELGYASVALYSNSQACPVVSDSVTFQVPFIDVDTSNIDISCNGLTDGSISLGLSGNSGGYIFQWEDGTTSLSLSDLGKGSYCYSVTDYYNCLATDCVVIEEPDELLASLSKIDVSCNGFDKGEAYCYPSGGTPAYNYNWSTGSQDTSSLNLEIGTYSVTVSDANGCTTAGSVQIDLMSLPPVDFRADRIDGCNPLTVSFISLYDSSDYIFTWNYSIGTAEGVQDGSSTSFTYTEDGNHSVSLTISTSAGCDSTLEYGDLIHVLSRPEAMFSYEPDYVTLANPEVIFINESSSDADFFIWDFGDGKNSYYPDPVHNFVSAGIYPVELVVLNQDYCSDTAVLDVEVREIVTFYAPTAFTPLSHSGNQKFKVFGSGIDNSTFNLWIYNRFGEMVFHSTDIDEGWDGKKGHGRVAMLGVYAWRAVFNDLYGKEYIKTGTFTLIK